MSSQKKRVLQVISFLGLALSIVPAFLVFYEVVSKQTYLWLMILGMVLWFGTAIFWIKPGHLGK
jgi:predicted membrane channel-forming protein YqfA (hemolysin III family)